MKKNIILIVFVFLFGCGSDGKDGTTGPQGEQGIAGDKGNAGEQGAAGDKGDQGEKGLNSTEQISKILNLVTPYHDSILDIECSDWSSSWRGTGTKVSGGNIITAQHVTDGATSCFYYSGIVNVGGGGIPIQNGVRDQVQITNVNWNSVGKALKSVPFKIDYSPVLGELLLLVSLPLDLDSNPQFTFGNVNSELVVVSAAWNNVFTTDMAAAGGSSGGPVFNAQGQLVAIHVGGYSNGGLELNYTLPIR